ncbi:MAG: NAD(P)/FAD-dependent oxidoreductase [Vicinamibacterales bacterium]
MTTRVGILIAGLGPTGLGAAWRLAGRGRQDWLAVEADAVAGGLAGSTVDAHGFTWDYGGHVQFSHYEYFDTLMDDLLGVDGWHRHDRESWVWVRGRFVPYPFQLNLHRLPEDDAIRAIAGLVHAARAGAAGLAAPADFGGWIDRAFGPGIAALFMRPYNAKVWARAPERMAWHWIGDRVALVDLPRVVGNLRDDRDDVSWGPNNRFRFPVRGGTGAIWRALADRLARTAPGRLAFGRRLVALDTARRRASFADGSVVEYERLLSTIPLDELTRLSDLGQTLGRALDDLEYSSTHVIGVGLTGRPPAALATKCWMYFPEADCPFYRVTHFSHYAPANVADPAAQWSLMAEVSESSHRPLRRPDVVGDTVEGMLATGLVATRDAVHHTWHRRLERGYPVPSLHRDRALAALLPAFEARGVWSRGRFGAWKYEVSNQDHSFAQGVEAVDHWLDGTEEETLHHPDRVNSRRPPAPREAARG